MALNLKSLAFNATDPLRLAIFWAEALRWQVLDGVSGMVGLAPTDGTRFNITFLPATPNPKQGKNRLHLDLTTTSLEDQTASVEKLLALGARHIDIGQGAEELHVVLADPEGNEFCVIEPENSFLAGTGRLGSITCDGTRKVGYFWSEALGWPLVWDEDEETAIRAPDGTGPFVTWGPPVSPKLLENRLHLELAPTSRKDVSPEVDRLVSLGATRTGMVQDDEQKITMLDPDGNEFCLLVPDTESG